MYILHRRHHGPHWFALGIIIPVMVLALMDFGYDIGQIGIAMAAMSATVLLLEIPAADGSRQLGFGSCSKAVR